MAVYFDLGIDCGTSSEVADAIQAHFHGFTFRLPGVADVECEAVGRWHELGHWILSVWPRGLGYGLPGYRRPELLEFESQIKKEIYQHLSLISGYRRAIFGEESAECVMRPANEEELMDNQYTGMIYADADFPAPPPDRKVERFSGGYSIDLGPIKSPPTRDTGEAA